MMASVDEVVLPIGWPVRARLEQLARDQRIVFLAGLPGVGKSLLVQQLSLLAHLAGRQVHLLQWDVTRAAFETPRILARYPEIDGFTHVAIRKAVGLWARDAVLAWHESHPDPAAMLIAESALIGNRLTELVEPADDGAERLLASPLMRVVVPVPSREVRARIERVRAATITAPRHPREVTDAPPNVLQAIWREVHREAVALGLTNRVAGAEGAAGAPPAYDPVAYTAVFSRLLRARTMEILEIDRVVEGAGSVYHQRVPVRDLVATPLEVEQVMARVDRHFGSTS